MKTTVIGIGGVGISIMGRMIEKGVNADNCIAVDTDVKDLRDSKASLRVLIGEKTAKGLSTHGDPEIAQKASKENIDSVRECIKGSNVILISTMMGGGVGTFATLEVAKLIGNAGIPSIVITSKLSDYEGQENSYFIDKNIDELKKHVAAVIIA